MSRPSPPPFAPQVAEPLSQDFLDSIPDDHFVMPDGAGAAARASPQTVNEALSVEEEDRRAWLADFRARMNRTINQGPVVERPAPAQVKLEKGRHIKLAFDVLAGAFSGFVNKPRKNLIEVRQLAFVGTAFPSIGVVRRNPDCQMHAIDVSADSFCGGYVCALVAGDGATINSVYDNIADGYRRCGAATSDAEELRRQVATSGAKAKQHNAEHYLYDDEMRYYLNEVCGVNVMKLESQADGKTFAIPYGEPGNPQIWAIDPRAPWAILINLSYGEAGLTGNHWALLCPAVDKYRWDVPEMEKTILPALGVGQLDAIAQATSVQTFDPVPIIAFKATADDPTICEGLKQAANELAKEIAGNRKPKPKRGKRRRGSGQGP